MANMGGNIFAGLLEGIGKALSSKIGTDIDQRNKLDLAAEAQKSDLYRNFLTVQNPEFGKYLETISKSGGSGGGGGQVATPPSGKATPSSPTPPVGPKLNPGEILVKIKQTGETAALPADEFDGNLYERVN